MIPMWLIIAKLGKVYDVINLSNYRAITRAAEVWVLLNSITVTLIDKSIQDQGSIFDRKQFLNKTTCFP